MPEMNFCIGARIFWPGLCWSCTMAIGGSGKETKKSLFVFLTFPSPILVWAVKKALDLLCDVIKGKQGASRVNMSAWQRVAMESLKFHTNPPCPTLLCPAGVTLLKRPYGRHAPVFYPFGHPTPYAYEGKHCLLNYTQVSLMPRCHVVTLR
jgi:hypothetical protein